MKTTSDKLDLNQLAKLFGVMTPDEYQDRLTETDSTYYGQAYHAAIEEGKTEDQAIEIAMEAEALEVAEYFHKYCNALIHAAEYFFEMHELCLAPINLVKGFGWEYKIRPVKTWRDSANKIRETINGVGYFHFSTLKEFLNSGPYTARQATLHHLGWIKDYAEVYGTTSADRIIDHALRY